MFRVRVYQEQNQKMGDFTQKNVGICTIFRAQARQIEASLLRLMGFGGQAGVRFQVSG